MQRIRPTGKDIDPFRTYEVPNKQEVLDCPRSKVLSLDPMMDPIKGETNQDLHMALEFKHTRDFYHKHAQSEVALFSRSRITHLARFKTRHFQNSRFFEYGIDREDGTSQTITTADLDRMSSADLLDLAYILRHRSETKLEVKFHHLSLREFINSIVHDFGWVDVELHPLFQVALPLPEADVTFEGVGDISKGYSMEPIRALAYEEDQPEKAKSPELLCFRLEEKHVYPTNLLCNFVALL